MFARFSCNPCQENPKTEEDKDDDDDDDDDDEGF